MAHNKMGEGKDKDEMARHNETMLLLSHVEG